MNRLISRLIDLLAGLFPVADPLTGVNYRDGKRNRWAGWLLFLILAGLPFAIALALGW